MKLAVVSAPDNANIIADIETNELASIFGIIFWIVYIDADGAFLRITTDINAITISNIAGIVEPNAPVFVKNFPNAIPRVLTKDNSQNIMSESAKINILLFDKSGFPSIYAIFIAKNVKKEEYQRFSYPSNPK